MLSGANLGSPWATDLSHGAGNLLECALGSYSTAPLLHWRLPVVLMLRLLPFRLLRNLMFGLMGVGLRIGFLLFLPLVLGVLLVILVVFGLGVLGVKLMVVIRGTRVLLVVVGTVLFRPLQ